MNSIAILIKNGLHLIEEKLIYHSEDSVQHEIEAIVKGLSTIEKKAFYIGLFSEYKESLNPADISNWEFNIGNTLDKPHEWFEKMKLFSWLKEKVHNSQNKDKIQGFKTQNIDLQRLYKSLVDEKYIDKETSEKDFISCFSWKDTYSLTTSIIWIDKPPRNKTAINNAATVFELIYLLKRENLLIYENEDSFEKSLNKKVRSCFPNVKDSANKKTYKAEQNTPRKKILLEIIQSCIKLNK